MFYFPWKIVIMYSIFKNFAWTNKYLKLEAEKDFIKWIIKMR